MNDYFKVFEVAYSEFLGFMFNRLLVFFRNQRINQIFRKIQMFLSHLNNDDFEVAYAEFYGFNIN